MNRVLYVMVEDALLACIESILSFWRDLCLCTVVYLGFNVVGGRRRNNALLNKKAIDLETVVATKPFISCCTTNLHKQPQTSLTYSALYEGDWKDSKLIMSHQMKIINYK